MNEEKVKTLLYILMRDHLPVGVLDEIVETNIDKFKGPFTPTFSSPGLEICAEDILQSLK